MKQRAEGDIERQFYGYVGRECPSDPMMGPWRPGRSSPRCRSHRRSSCPRFDTFGTHIRKSSARTGLLTSFNPSFDTGDRAHHGWLCPEHLGLDQGPVVLMIENFRSGLLWRLMRECPAIVTGLRRAGFRKGWLGSSTR